jgi:hypothetical protein
MNHHRPLSVTATLVLVLLNAIFWLVLGVIVIAGLQPGLPDLPLYKAILAVLSFAAAGMLLGCFIALPRHNRLAYAFTLAVFTAASIVIFFDQVGWIDLAVLALNLAPLALLIRDRAWYLQKSPRSVGKP